MHDANVDVLLTECLTFVLDAQEIDGPYGEFTQAAECAYTAIALKHIKPGRNDALGAAVDALRFWRYECEEFDLEHSRALTRAVIDEVEKLAA